MYGDLMSRRVTRVDANGVGSREPSSKTYLEVCVSRSLEITAGSLPIAYLWPNSMPPVRMSSLCPRRRRLPPIG